MKHREFRHVLLMETGGHDWQLTKAHKNTIFGDSKYHKEYQSYTCTKCGMGAIQYTESLGSFFVVPVYPKEAVFNCPEEFGKLDVNDGALIAVLGGGEGKTKKTKKKNKKKKKGKKKSKWIVKVARARTSLKKEGNIVRVRSNSKKEVKRKRVRQS